MMSENVACLALFRKTGMHKARCLALPGANSIEWDTDSTLIYYHMKLQDGMSQIAA